MKKIFSVAAVAILCQTVGVTSSLAGAIDNLHNYSAEYIRTLNRNAATDSADIVAYNPAGVMAMDDGSYVNLSLQYLDKDYENILTGLPNGQDGTLTQDEPSIIPGFFALHKKEKWAAFAAVTVPAGGGKVDFEEGSATLQLLNLSIFGGLPLTAQQSEGEEVYVGVTLGGAYQLNDDLSVSAGLRHIKADRSAKASFTNAGGADVAVDYESEADGWGGIFGVNYKASDKLNLAARYETRTKLDFEHTVTADTALGAPPTPTLLQVIGVTDGMEERRDLPAILGLGLSHQCTPALKVDVNLTYYFNEDANWAGAEDDVNDGYEFGIALEYAVNDRLRVSGGYMYTETGIDVEHTVAESPKLDVNTFGGGFAYALKDNLELNVGLGVSLYDDDSYQPAPTTIPGLTVGYEKEVIFYSTGLQYSF
ncbi:MAG: outer membrane protein transport protein [Desulfobulbaceae bacterium]|uniref:Outer membrane protein transport protein n=1 Tax=Candidatus Desulfatifera sulfidica TaxID=2841691 RepID=A0A8J6NBI2_9BACT|nr:outer membrane protein transport protein [Candidatus Desulfatifera sulfidica]